MVSLKPERSRVRMVGLKGVNVDEEEDGERAREWDENYVWDGEGERVGYGEEESREVTRAHSGDGRWEVDWEWRFS